MAWTWERRLEKVTCRKRGNSNWSWKLGCWCLVLQFKGRFAAISL